MVCLVRNRRKFYRKTMLDVWGLSFTYKKPTREIKFIKMMEQERIFRKWYYRREVVYSFKKKIRFRRKRKREREIFITSFFKTFLFNIKIRWFKKNTKKSYSKTRLFWI